MTPRARSIRSWRPTCRASACSTTCSKASTTRRASTATPPPGRREPPGSSSADGRTWVFHLRPEARWSNGAAGHGRGLRLCVAPRGRSAKPARGYAQALAPIDNALEIALGHKPPEALGVEALDAHTLTVHLTGTDAVPARPDGPALSLSGVPAGRSSAYGDDWVRPEHIVSNGAFVLRENVHRHSHHARKEPVLLGCGARAPAAGRVLRRRLIARAGRALSGGRSAMDRFASPPTSALAQIACSATRWSTRPTSAPTCSGSTAACRPSQDNPALRAALVLAIDREPLVRYMKEGMYEPAYTLMPPLPGYRAAAAAPGAALRRRATRAGAPSVPRGRLFGCASAARRARTPTSRGPTSAISSKRWPPCGARCSERR